MASKGKFIVLYGINNLGKTTQAEHLTTRLNNEKIKAEQIKYPLYDIQPSGSIIYDYLRSGNPYKLSPTEVQIMYAFNRTQFSPILEKKLNEGLSIVAEDYTATSITWGVGAGVHRQFLEKVNSHLRLPDLAVLLDGKRFMKGLEKGHKHEEDDELTSTVQRLHQELAQEYNWPVVNANQTEEKVEEEIFQHVKTILK
jgi:thymidylate kinase